MSNHPLPSEVARIVRRFYSGLGSPLAADLLRKLEVGDYDGLVGCPTPDPRSYSDALSYFRDASASALLRKCSDIPASFDRRANAVSKWWAAERQCYAANERLARFLPVNGPHGQLIGDDLRIHEFLMDVKKLISSWIGPNPSSLTAGRFGPGSTFSRRGNRITVPDKMSHAPSLTRDCVWFLPQWLGTEWGSHWAQQRGELSFVPGNRFATVPKTAVTDRAIAAEPDINVFYQLGLGRELRRKLERSTCGRWDLDRAQRIHGQVARYASRTREFATLDLSNASDTLCRTLVEVLLPAGWYSVLSSVRSPKTLIDGHWVVLEKFSSMGNGYTFELETIVFAALSCVASRKLGHKGLLGIDTFVFGDDIIVKDDVVRLLTGVLRYCGFELNREKSFHGDVPFRESCGQDFFNGVSVRPHFLKELPYEPQHFVGLANGIRRVSSQLSLAGGGDCIGAWFAVLDCVPSHIRSLRGPVELGDIVIHDEPGAWTTRWRGGIRHIRVYRPTEGRRVPWQVFDPGVVLACALYGVGDGRCGVIPRGSKSSYKVGWVAWS